MTGALLRRPIATWVLFSALVILGIYSLPKLRVESMPEEELPSLTITTTWSGASPAAVQRAITVPLEEAVRRVHGIETVTARSYPAYSSIDVTFRREVDVEMARLELAEQVGGVRRSLPLNAGAPQIRGSSPEEFRTRQFFTVSLVSPLDPNELRDQAEEWIVPQVLSVDGVASAEMQGGAGRLLRVTLDREKLRQLALTPDEVMGEILMADDVAAGGIVRRGAEELLVSIRDEATVARLTDLVVARRGGRLLRLSEIAALEWGYEDPTYFVRVNAENMVQLVVEKRRGSNALTVSRALRARLPQIAAGLRFPVTLEVDEDEGGELERKLVDLIYRSLAILGILLLMMFASMRNLALSAAVVAAVLISVMISLSLFYFLRISINFITISGLTVCFGMVIDNSILVLDSVERRLRSAGRGPRRGRRTGLSSARLDEEIAGATAEVGFPILATTLTTIVAFLSFVFLSGRLSLYYTPLAVAVITALGASIFVALGWMPVAVRTLLAGGAKRAAAGADPPAGGAAASGGDASAHAGDAPAPPAAWRPRGFERVTALTLRAWWAVLLLTLGVLAASAYVYWKKVDKGGFWRLPEREMLYLGMRLPEGTDVLMTYETLCRFESVLVPIPEGVRVRASVYRNRGSMQIEFDDRTLASELPLLFRTRLIDLGEKMAGMGIYIQGFADQAYFKGFFGDINFNSTIKLTGYNSQILERIGQDILRQVARNRRVRQSRLLNDLGRIYSVQDESIISIRRDRLRDYDLSVAEVVAFLRRLIGLDYPFSMVIDGASERVQLGYADADQIEFSSVAGQFMLGASGRRVRLGDILTLETVPLAGPIVREEQRYTKYATWEYIGTEAMRSRYVQSVLERLELPYGYAAEEAERQFLSEEEEGQLTLMILLTVAFIYMVMAALFESLMLPLLVLLSVPMSLVGVVLIFWLTGSTFDSSARIGLVLLFGIVVNNAILLVARYRTEARALLESRRPGALLSGIGERPAAVRGAFELRRLARDERVGSLREVICRGTSNRLRSILLTSGTTIVGLAPLLIRFEKIEGKDIWENLALSSIGGLTAGVILILPAVPVLYYLSVRLAWFVRERGLRLKS